MKIKLNQKEIASIIAREFGVDDKFVSLYLTKEMEGYGMSGHEVIKVNCLIDTEKKIDQEYIRADEKVVKNDKEYNLDKWLEEISSRLEYHLDTANRFLTK